MVRFTGGLLLFTALAAARPPSPQQQQVQHVLDISDASSKGHNPRKLHGKFLHITDIHPDPFYKPGSDSNGGHPCHAGNGDAGYFGAEKTECDSPFTLVNATFDWIKHNIRDEIDFVIWTGDSARHDNDEDHPRTSRQVEQLNKFVVGKFDEVFGKPDNRQDPDPTNDFIIPIVPTYGNNDILPHNIFQPGPNKWTKKYLTIWEKFVPQEQRHSFARGGWFYTEVIPKRLAVFSLNTLYFFESNGAVDGCDDPNEPGYEHFEWLRIQLEFLRQRGMKAILMGHVPPARTESKQNWDETCYQKYTLWLRQYRDVVVGNIFGHMNIDHFMFQDVKQLTYKFKIDGVNDRRSQDHVISSHDGLHARAKTDYLSDLRQIWGDLPAPPRGMSLDSIGINASDTRRNQRHMKRYLKKIGGPFGERFSLSLVSPSVVPNFYPTLRIIEYNITGLEKDHPALMPTASTSTDIEFMREAEYHTPSSSVNTETAEEDFRITEDYKVDKKKHKKKKGKKHKPNFVVPNPPSKTASPGPGYSPQSLSFLSWRQLYANITRIDEAVNQDIAARKPLTEIGSRVTVKENLLTKHFVFELEYDTRNDKVYHMKDLTMRSWLNIAEKIGRATYAAYDNDDDAEHDHGNDTSVGDIRDMYALTKHRKGKQRKGQTLKKNHLWHAFVKRAFVGTKDDEQLEDEFD